VFQLLWQLLLTTINRLKANKRLQVKLPASEALQTIGRALLLHSAFWSASYWQAWYKSRIQRSRNLYLASCGFLRSSCGTAFCCSKCATLLCAYSTKYLHVFIACFATSGAITTSLPASLSSQSKCWALVAYRDGDTSWSGCKCRWMPGGILRPPLRLLFYVAFGG